jgi:hypothetical protein
VIKPKNSSEMVPKTPVEGEPIFPASEITPLALKWKDLNAKGHHTEAMLVLDEVIQLSTPMFERFAQHEEYTNTVDLSILVSAAQEKVVKWLLKWEPKLGKIFSWFSKSFSANTFILLSDGSSKRIKDIVDNRSELSVMSWNRSLNTFEAKPIINWICKPATLEMWRKIWVKMPLGNDPGNWKDCSTKRFVLTADHEVYTNRGLVRVCDLNPALDVLYAGRPTLTPDGMSVLLGKYLGDGFVNKKGYFQIRHGAPQKLYVEYLAKQFGSRSVHKGSCTLKATGKTYASYKLRLLMNRLWKNCPLPSKKEITNWMLDNLNPVVMAYWYMDDGWLKTDYNGLQTPGFCSESFTPDENTKLCNSLESEWGLSATPWKVKWGHGYRISILSNSADQFFRMIAPYVLPLFNYKLPEPYRVIPKKQIECVRYEAVPCQSFFVTGLKKLTPDLQYRYDVTVADNHNVVIFPNGKTQNGSNSGLCVTQCAKHAFLSEIVKANQYKKRYHVTGDNLEKYYGTIDHESDRHDILVEFDRSLADLYCRWGSPQEIGAIRYLVECLVHDLDNHSKQAAIRGAAYAWGISVDMAKFFYSWVLIALRDLHYARIRVPFTEEDLVRHSLSFTNFIELYQFMPHEQIKRLIAIMGGQRIKVPTIAQIAKIKEDYDTFEAVMVSDLDPATIAEVAKKKKRSPRTAADAYAAMVESTNPNRSGEYAVYGEDDGTVH